MTQEAMRMEFEELLGQYWDIAYDEARNGINLAHKANGVLHELRTLFAASRAQGAAPTGDAVLWQYRWLNPCGDRVSDESLDWRPVTPWNSLQTLEQRIAELRAHEYQGKRCYEVRGLVVAPSNAEGPKPDGKGADHG